MGNRECGWVRARLPLWVDIGSGNGRPEDNGDGGDLTTKDGRELKRHLTHCASCRSYGAALEQALGALQLAAAHLPVLPKAPSLWPMLERQIAACDTGATSRWPWAVRALVARSVGPWGDLDGERPLRRAWTRDTIQQALAGQNLQKPESNRRPGLVLKFSVAAAVLIALIVIPVLHRYREGARFTIIANSAPLADPVVQPTAADELPWEPLDRDINDVPTNQLVEAEPSRTPETPASGLDAAAPKSSPHTRFGFDLDHGIPMPPDTREAKPVY